MLYASTRGGCPSVGWEEAISSGYAPDGGLYVPVRVPRVSLDTLKEVCLFMQLSTQRANAAPRELHGATYKLSGAAVMHRRPRGHDEGHVSLNCSGSSISITHSHRVSLVVWEDQGLVACSSPMHTLTHSIDAHTTLPPALLLPSFLVLQSRPVVCASVC
jgi:hypothetical protein